MMSPLGSKSAKSDKPDKKADKKAAKEAAKQAAAAAKAAKQAAKGAGKAKAAAAAPAAVGKGVVVEKPGANIYTMLLVISFVAIVVGCVCLYLEMAAYDMQIKAKL